MAKSSPSNLSSTVLRLLLALALLVGGLRAIPAVGAGAHQLDAEHSSHHCCSAAAEHEQPAKPCCDVDQCSCGCAVTAATPLLPQLFRSALIAAGESWGLWRPQDPRQHSMAPLLRPPSASVL